MLRAPWRILLFFIATILCWVAAQLLLHLLVGPRATSVGDAGWMSVFALVGGHAIMLRWIDRRPWSDVGLDAAAARPRKLLHGFVLGALAIGIPTAALIAVGWLARTPGTSGSVGAAALRLSLFLLPAALAEELLTRGYVFSVLRGSWGWRPTLVVTSVAFGLLHLANPGVTVESVLLVILAGIFLGAILVATGSLYAAWMAHFAWNWTMAVLFHASVSGFGWDAPGYRYVDAGPDWITGGPWGPEGGVLAGLGMLSGLVYLFARRARRGES